MINRNTTRLVLFAAALLVPATAGAPALAEDGTGAADFVDNFTPYAAPITRTGPGTGAVDMAAFAPALEQADASDATTGRTIGGGTASFYGKRFAGRRTASGESFNPGLLTAAHKTLPFGTRVRVTNPANGKSVIVRINDRGPYHGNRVIDLSRSAAEQVGIVGRGSGRVELALLD